ncbi:MAG: alkaline phosphatase D family protein [Bacteroidales bacterium]
MKNLTLIVTFLLLLISCGTEEVDSPYFLYASEPTQSSIILFARINNSDTLVNYDIQGVPADIYFEITEDTSRKILHIDPLIAMKTEDFTVRHEFTGLEPGTQYFYRIKYLLKENHRGHSVWQSFKTLPSADSNEDISFVMVTGSNFYRFSTGLDQYGKQAEEGGNLTKGFPGYLAILERDPYFFIGNGDNVYYDQPRDSAATEPLTMRKYWHRLFHMKNFQAMAAEVPIYWIKDDHDHRYNDSDTLIMDANGTILLPTNEDVIKIFLEQAAFSAKDYKAAVPYRTYKLNKDLQIWMVEGRDFRSPNNMPDGPDKSIWGREQLTWLKSTLEQSDAKFKLLISPTPMVGPDDAYKKDNHTNPGGFRFERDAFVEWLKEKEMSGNGFYVLCGDRHWQYHSLHPNGLEEFSCGALVDANSRLGRAPGDPESTDPEGKITQFYTQETPSGGFLEVNCVYEGEDAALVFNFFDEKGELLYSVKKEG